MPGPCVMCGTCAPLRTLSDGMFGDGICELCDAVRFSQLHPRACWVPWAIKIERRRSADLRSQGVLVGALPRAS